MVFVFRMSLSDTLDQACDVAQLVGDLDALRAMLGALAALDAVVRLLVCLWGYKPQPALPS